MDDLNLLDEYARTGSEAAFATLVDRHVDLVYAACLRHLRDPAAADDATQAVSVALARRAGPMPRGTVVGGWLYRTAVHKARHAVRAAAMRRRHGMAAAEQWSRRRSASGDGAEAAETIDRALDRLRPPERTAFVLRYLQGRSLAEVAAEMRTTEEAARKRVSRGLDRLWQLLRPTGAAGSTFGVAAVGRALRSRSRTS